MAEIVNLNRRRKAKARDDKAAEAADNRIKFGRSKAEKELARERERLAERALEAHRRERDPE